MSFIPTTLKIIISFSFCFYLELEIAPKFDSSKENQQFSAVLETWLNYSKIIAKSASKSALLLQSLVTRRSTPPSKRFRGQNFSSLSSGAKILQSKGVMSPSNILSKDKDKYISFVCSENHLDNSIIISLGEDARVEKIGLVFLESYSNWIRGFEMELSIVGKNDSWEFADSFEVQNLVDHQSFKLSQPKIARFVKLNFKSYYPTGHHYCTITQVLVGGKTYLSYQTEKTTERLQKEIKETLEKNYQEVELDVNKQAQQQAGDTQSVMVDLKTYFREVVEKQKIRQRRRQEFINVTTCQKFEDMILWAKNQCSISDYIVTLINEEGPLESYFQVLNLKIKKIEKINNEFRTNILSNYKDNIQKLEKENIDKLKNQQRRIDHRDKGRMIKSKSVYRRKRRSRKKGRHSRKRRKRVRLIPTKQRKALSLLGPKYHRQKGQPSLTKARMRSKNRDLNNRIQSLEKKIDLLISQKKGILSSKKVQHIFTFIILLVALFLALVFFEGVLGGGQLLKKSKSWGISLKNLKSPQSRVKLWSTTMGSTKIRRTKISQKHNLNMLTGKKVDDSDVKSTTSK